MKGSESQDIREIYNGIDLPDISKTLEAIGLGDVKMLRVSTGFTTDVFDTGFGQVIKLTNRDAIEEDSVNPLSRYILQPVCTCILNALYDVAIFPKLDTSHVKDHHSAALKAGLAKEGFNFSDDKPANVGLSDDGTPYVIDPDAVTKGKPNSVAISHLALAIRWPESQWSKFSCKVLGGSKELTQQNCGYWTLSDNYGKLPQPEEKQKE